MVGNIGQVNMGTENQGIDKVPSSTKINDKLNQLQDKINNIPFEKKENGMFNLKFDGVVLPIDLTPEKLVEAYGYLKSRLIIAQSNYKKNDPAIFVKGFFSGNGNLDISGRIDPKYMLEDKVISIFGDKMDIVIDFLNSVLNRNRDGKQNNDTLDGMFDSGNIDIEESYNIYEEIKNSNQNINRVSQLKEKPNRKESLIVLQQFLQNGLNWDKGLFVSHFSSFVYDNIIFELKNSSIQINKEVNFQLSDNGDSIEIKQLGTVLGRYIIKDYNDQMILLLLNGKKTIEDFRVTQ